MGGGGGGGGRGVQQVVLDIALLLWVAKGEQVPVEAPAVEQGVEPAQLLMDQHHGTRVAWECDGDGGRRGDRRYGSGGGED